MSSHHIVRDNQEPALLLVDVSESGFAFIQELLEWSPRIMVCEQALEEVLKWDIKIDAAIVEEVHRNRWLKALQHQAPVQLFTCPAGEPPWVTAFYLLKTTGQKSVHVVGVHPHQIQFVPDDLDITCVHRHTRWVYVRSGRFEKWLPAGVRIDVLGENAVVSGVDNDGYTQADGLVRIAASSPSWIGEQLPVTST